MIGEELVKKKEMISLVVPIFEKFCSVYPKFCCTDSRMKRNIALGENIHFDIMFFVSSLFCLVSLKN